MSVKIGPRMGFPVEGRAVPTSCSMQCFFLLASMTQPKPGTRPLYLLHLKEPKPSAKDNGPGF